MVNGLISQLSPQFLVFVVVGIVADDVDTSFTGVDGQQLCTNALSVDAAILLEQYLRGLVSVVDRVQISPLATADGEHGARGAPSAGAARVVGGVGRVGVIQDHFATLDVGSKHGQFV